MAAFIFYIPANLLPITKVTSLGAVQSDTIMSGVIYFIQSGMWPIALVIFVASVAVPLLKLLMLTYLLYSVKRKSAWRPRDRTRLYRITEAVGRWSMVDIYVVTILVALVNLGALATIEAGPGAVFFATVVVITMIAAMSFDPRLIWDAKENQDE
jgi:paraquat-inducible protein A